MPQFDKRGNKLPDKLIFPPATPAKSAEFVRSIRQRFPKHADAILNHLRVKANEHHNHTDKASGYSGAKILWDTERDEEMNPAQKVALLLQLTGVGTKGKLAKEVPGFEAGPSSSSAAQ